ncbi:MAG: translation elongation factor Ts [Candidatus Brocadiae bacterium]|nr:translation elongation factor Ts [Candidatus Brocadiia bacterium]
MAVTAQQVKELRDKTGAGLMDCKRALTEAAGDQDKAVTFLREKGLAKALAKGSRVTAEGIIISYVHGDGRIGVLLELACETDFVARNEEFRNLAGELALQVAAMNPRVIRPEDLPEETLEAERKIYRQQFADKPEQVRERIADGKMEKFYEQVCLVRQPYIRDDARTVDDLIKETIARLGEKVEVRRFVRMELGRNSED